MIITCPKCFSADDVLPPRRLPDHLLQYRCTNPLHGNHDWLTTRNAVQPPGEVQEGVTDDLLDPSTTASKPTTPFWSTESSSTACAHDSPTSSPHT